MNLFRTNQVGYTPMAKKPFVTMVRGKTFRLVDALTDSMIYEGPLSPYKEDEASGDRLTSGDFSHISREGRYYLEVDGSQSDRFSIGSYHLKDCVDGLLKAMYYQRCGCALEEAYAGPWHHKACHLQKSYLFQEDLEAMITQDETRLIAIDTRGGWHDAGDYGKYTVPAAKAVADLLLAYEFFQGAFDHPIGIPESNLTGADILHEARYELDFLLKLQRADGAVYTKVATRFFPGMIMPEEDLDPLMVFDVSTPATGDFCGVMAMAARLYEALDPSFAGTCLKAAKRAYAWLSQEEAVLFKNPNNIGSGEYGDKSDLDERYFAAAELYRTTGDTTYHQNLIALVDQLDNVTSLGWADVSGYGTIAYLFSDQEKDPATYKLLRDTWLREAQSILKTQAEDGYGISLEIKDYIWGSMMVLMNQAIHLCLADQLEKDERYVRGIWHNWHYLYGMNPMDLSYVTGFGKRAVMAPHHRPSEGDGVLDPVPGLVSGGPCAGLNDAIAKEHCEGKAPAKCFVDHMGSYATNEITIYWNSPAIFVGAYLMTR